MPMFYVGVALFGIAGVGALVIRATGEPQGEESPNRALFMAGTGLAALVIAVVLDIGN